MSSRRLIAQNTLAQLVGKAINTLSSLLIAVLVGRFLGETFYGDFTKVFATTTLLFMVLDFGFNAIVVKKITHHPHLATPQFQNLFGLRLILSLILYVGLLAFLFLLPTPQNQGYTLTVKISIAIFALQYFAQASYLTTNAIFQSQFDYTRSVIASSLGSLIQLLLVAILVQNTSSLTLIILAHLLGTAVIAVVSLTLVRRYIKSIIPTFNVGEIKTLLIHTAPIGLALVLNLFATHTDTIIIALFRPTEEVGFYGLARRIFDVTLVFPTFFMNATYPILLQKQLHNSLDLKKVFTQTLQVLSALSLLATAALFFLSPLITLIRPEFSPAITTLKILSFSLPIFFLTSLFMWTMVAVGKERQLARIYGLALLVNLSTNLIAIPRFGFNAAAVTTLATEMVVLLLLVKPVKRYLKVHAP